MFDPTIFDNLKVVLEGVLYDLDAEKRIVVTGREDLVDLAGMSRTFKMRIQLPEGVCVAEVELTSGLLDFAGELRRLRLADEVPGSHLLLSYWLPGDRVKHLTAVEAHMQTVWGEVAAVRHERMMVLPAAERDMAAEQPATEETAGETDAFSEGHYRVSLLFRGKVDEDNIHDIEPLLEHFVSTLGTLEELEETEGSR